LLHHPEENNEKQPKQKKRKPSCHLGVVVHRTSKALGHWRQSGPAASLARKLNPRWFSVSSHPSRLLESCHKVGPQSNLSLGQSSYPIFHRPVVCAIAKGGRSRRSG
jgi:hypothetical protein